MSRVLKNTRIKGLPGKVQLQELDAVSGSYPVKRRIASDNRNGIFSSSFDESKTVLFKSYLSGSENQGFNVVAADGTYPNYALGPAFPGGNVLAWWPFAKIDGSAPTFSTPNAAIPTSYTGSWSATGYSLDTKVPPYYNNDGTIWFNQRSIFMNSTGTGVKLFFSSSDSRNNEFTINTIPSFTLSSHFRIDTTLPYNPIFWAGTEETYTNFELVVASTGEFLVGFYSNPGKYLFYSTSAGLVTDKTWYHAALAVSGNSNSDIGCTLYFNGTPETLYPVTDTGFTGMPTTTGSLHLGMFFDSVGYLGNDAAMFGNFSQFVFANRPITAAEVTYLYNGTVPSASVGVMLPAGLHTSHPSLKRFDSNGSFIDNPETTTDFVVSAIVRKGVGDSLVKYTPGQDAQPFRDDWNPAVEGKSQGGTFYATGSKVSDIGEGFEQPLWSKTKIEIDLTPSSAHSVRVQNFTSGSNNYPMCYWNKDLRKWQGIGNGAEFGSYANSLTGLRRLWNDQCIGFAQGLDNGASSVRDLAAGAPSSNFGFPYNSKFHATSSNTIRMSDYISVPFLVEKVVLEFSGAMAQNNYVNSGSTKATISTFFILNQRGPFLYNSEDVQTIPYRTTNTSVASFVVTGATIPETINGNYCATSRDLVTWAQLVAFQTANTTAIERMSRELNLLGTNGNWSGRYSLSGTVKSPLSSEGHAEMSLGDFTQFMLINKNGSRNGLYVPGGRDFVGTLDRGAVVSSASLNFNNAPVFSLERYGKINPYLLMPTDNLIFGWQLPLFTALNDDGFNPTYSGQGPTFTFAAAPAKLVIYGSMIREGREFHDTLNQHLSSISAHEVLE